MTGNSRNPFLVVFPSELGWMAMAGSETSLSGLTLGHPSAVAALTAMGPRRGAPASTSGWQDDLIARLQAYAAGDADDFSDVPVDVGPQTEFQRQVVACCRRIARGKTMSYGQVAAHIGCAGAARAVGNCMAANRVPIIIPCHRVVGGDGRLHGYSAMGGLATKRRLLELEAVVFSGSRVVI